MLEKHIVRQILGYLRALGCHCGKVKTMGVKRGKSFCFDPFLMRGVPDILCFHKDKMYFIEVKANYGKQSPEQKIFQESCIKSNIPYLLVFSVDEVMSVIH